MIQMLFPAKYQSINELKNLFSINSWNELKSKAQQQVKILVVDDQTFEPLQTLRNNGFQIQHIQDVTDLTQIEGYGIVLFDLQGVGVSLNSQMQGAHLIRKAKRDYPNKYIIAYTGSAKDDKIQQAITWADTYVAKDMPTQDWCDTLETAVEEVANPINAWKKFRVRLLNEGITPWQLTKLEDAFVRKYDEGAEEVKKELLKSLDKSSPTPHIKSIANSLIDIALKHIVYISVS